MAEKEKYKITITITPEEAKDQLLKLLKKLRELGILGSTRCFKISDAVSPDEKEWSFYFDGDGDHRILLIEKEKVQDD